MSLANTTTYADYNCDGTNKVFSIPFITFSDDQIEVYLYDDVTETYTLLVAGGDYVVTPPALVGDRPIEIETTDPYPVGNIIRVQRSTTLQQVIHYINNSGFLATDHEKGLDRIVMMIQEISQQLGYALKLSTVDGILNVNPELPPLQDNSVLVYNATTKSFDSVLVADLLAYLEGAGGLPTGGDEFALLEKNSATNNDTRWTDPLVYTGFTQRFNQIIDVKGAKAVLDYIMNMGYVQPNLSLVGNIATGLREIGDVVSGVTLTANFTKTLDDLSALRFYLNPSTLLDTQAVGPGSGSGNNVYATPFSNTITFRAEVDDVSAQAKPSRTATLTYTFVRPYFWGSGATGLTAANVAAMTKDIRASQDNITRNFTVGGGNYFYFAQPASYPAITKIYDANNFEVQGGFTSFTGNYTALDGSTQSLRVYVNTAPIGVDTLLRYVR